MVWVCISALNASTVTLLGLTLITFESKTYISNNVSETSHRWDVYLGFKVCAIAQKPWGLMYKDLRGFPTETWRTLKPKCPPTYKNIRMYQCVRTHESKYISFVHPNQRGIERTCQSTRLLPGHAPT